MVSEPIRDPVNDHLLTPQNSAFVIIDYQPVQVNSIASMDRQILVNNIIGTAKAAVAYGLPIIHSTVNVKTGLNKPPIPRSARRSTKTQPTTDHDQCVGRHRIPQGGGGDRPQEADHDRAVDRSVPDLSGAGRAKEGYEVYARRCGRRNIGRGSEAALRRIEEAGAKLISVPQLFCELQRDWKRTETVPAFINLFIETGGTAGIQFSYDKQG